MDNNPDILSDEDKQYIRDNYNKMSPFQMAMRRGKTTEGTKCNLIADFVKAENLSPNEAPTVPVVSTEIVVAPAPTPAPVAPITLAEIVETKEIPVIDNSNGGINQADFIVILKGLNIAVRQPPSEKDKKDIQFLTNQMLSKRYILTYDSFKSNEYKALFREEFIRALWGKGEMPQEEVNDFIDVCVETLFQYDARCKIKELERRKEDISKYEKDLRLKNAQLSGLDSLMMELNDKHSLSTKRASEIKKTLGANREQRLKDSRPQGLTIVALVEAFQNSEKRDALIKMQENADEKLKKTILLLDELDEMKALILGVSPDELVKGGL